MKSALGETGVNVVVGAVTYVEVNGFRFSRYYYEKLWNTGRKAPSLIAKLILEGTGGKGIADPLSVFDLSIANAPAAGAW